MVQVGGSIPPTGSTAQAVTHKQKRRYYEN